MELQEALHEAFEALEEAHQQLDVVLTHPPPDAGAIDAGSSHIS